MAQDTSPNDQGAEESRRGSHKEKLFTRDFLFATLINLMMTTGFFTLVTGMAVYAASEFGAGETAAGFAASAFVVGALFARIFAGKWVNTLGRRGTLILCMLLYTLASLAYIWVNSFELLIALRFLHGIGLGFGQTALTAAVFDIIPKSRRGEGSGYYLLANALPPALGPLLAIQLSEAYGFETMFVAVTAMSGAALLFAVFMRVPEVKPVGASMRQRLMLRPRDIIEPRAFSIALVAMFVGIVFASVMTFLNGYARSLGMLDAASIYFLVYSVCMLATRLVTGRIQDRFGDNWVLYPAITVFIGSMGLLAWAPGQWAIIASGALAGAGFGSMLPALQAAIANRLPTPRISIGISTNFIMMDIGFGFAPLFLGPLVEAGGYQVMYTGCTIMVVLTLLIYWWVHGRHDVRQGVPRRGPKKGQEPPRTGTMPTV
ncbi:MFS transporter [Nesterenkonia flava]|uniref:MFS transporter n=1 Tax=Nesterenkonia flava TaxID=469799 RepID=A0ABU1FU77_9MICC|nr:MFS transporter [Nesterenkonia flava]MDR5712228.1 MFS transporter [Nesterenkonia flava]